MADSEALRATIVSLFPEMFGAITESGITRRAVLNGLVELHFINPRDYAHDRHRTVDDRPYGGGPGMVMKAEPLSSALKAARKKFEADGAEPKVLYMSPQGRTLDRAGVQRISQQKNLILIAGRYEGVDERFLESEVDEEWSIGDYVLSGGELPAMVLLDAVIRRLPGALGDEQSAEQDSFENGLLDCPHYTRPEEYEGKTVPEVLLSGDHSKIESWRLKQALGRTYERRPELIEKLHLNDVQEALLEEYVLERKQEIQP